MTKQNLTDITILLDASSSMSNDRAKTVSAINEFIQGQKNTEGQCNLSLTTFHANRDIFGSKNKWYNKVWDGLNLKEINKLSDESYNPGGWTALYDATGKAIVDTGERLSKMREEDRPEKVLFVIMTDGEENSSREYNLNKLKEMIAHQESKYSWNFLFLGADFNTKAQTESLGLDADRSFDFAKSNMANAYKGLSRGVSEYRVGSAKKLRGDFASVVKTYENQAN